MRMASASGENRVQEVQGGQEDELSLIPAWSVILSILVFAAVQYMFHVAMPHHKHEMLPMRMRVVGVSRLCVDESAKPTAPAQ